MNERTPWHLDADLAGRYAQGRVSAAVAASAEQHLAGCAQCRALVPAEPARLDAVWAAVLDQVQAPRVGLVERFLSRTGLNPATARLIAATPALPTVWLTSAVVTLVLAVVAALADPGQVRVFVALAPVLPTLGVALCYGERTDPMHEVVAATPYSSLRLLAARTAFVVATSMAPAALLAPFLPGSTGFALAWLVPALAMSAVVLAASTYVSPAATACTLSSLWVLGAVVPTTSGDSSLLVAHLGSVQLGAIVALLLALVPLIRHRHQPVAPRRNP